MMTNKYFALVTHPKKDKSIDTPIASKREEKRQALVKEAQRRGAFKRHLDSEVTTLSELLIFDIPYFGLLLVHELPC